MNKRTAIDYISFPTSLGWIHLCATSKGICQLSIAIDRNRSEEVLERPLEEARCGSKIDRGRYLSFLEHVKGGIIRYLTQAVRLPETPVDVRWGTHFQQEVWKALLGIPFGETRSYAEIARTVGRPKAARAVGQACGKNPIGLIIPCHRVIGSGGGLGGYSGGIEIKKKLLELEQKGLLQIEGAK